MGLCWRETSCNFSPLNPQPLPFPLTSAELLSLFKRGKFFSSILPFSLNSFLDQESGIRGDVHLGCGNVPGGITSRAIFSAALNSYSKETSITFAMATSPCTVVELHLTSFPPIIFSWICPSHGQKACNSHSEFCLHGWKLKAKPAQPLQQCKLPKLKHLQCLY